MDHNASTTNSSDNNLLGEFMKTLYKLTSINKKTNAFKTVSKSCIMEGSETTEVSIPVKPITEVIITHKNH